MPFVLFFIGKIAIYTFWCWFGVRLLAPRRQDSALLIGLGLAILRIAVGLVVGLAWGFMASNLAPSEEFSRLGVDPSTFIFGFLILRLVQWTGIAWLITLGMPQSELGDSVRSWLWRFGGVMISFVGDLMGLILYLGFVGIVC
jgi:hypothetical protein